MTAATARDGEVARRVQIPPRFYFGLQK